VPHTKQSSKRKRLKKAVPVLGAAAAGLSLSLLSGASARPAAHMSAPSVGTGHEVILAEEEISDVSLATFYVFDKENSAAFRPRLGEADAVVAAVAAAGAGAAVAVAVEVAAAVEGAAVLEAAAGVEDAVAVEDAVGFGPMVAALAAWRVQDVQ
jgi:hypothetical protein